MLKVLRAEARRSYFHRSNPIFIATMFLFISLGVLFPFLDVIGGAPDSEALRLQFSFPKSVFYGLFKSSTILVLIAPAITAQFIGSDYQLDTWKMILPRTPFSEPSARG